MNRFNLSNKESFEPSLSGLQSSNRDYKKLASVKTTSSSSSRFEIYSFLPSNPKRTAHSIFETLLLHDTPLYGGTATINTMLYVSQIPFMRMRAINDGIAVSEVVKWYRVSLLRAQVRLDLDLDGQMFVAESQAWASFCKDPLPFTHKILISC